MKLYIETKVAAAVATGVMVLTAGAIAQSQSPGLQLNNPSNNPSVNMPTADQSGETLSDEGAPSKTQKKSAKHKTRTSSKHRGQRTQENQDTQTNGPVANPGE